VTAILHARHRADNGKRREAKAPPGEKFGAGQTPGERLQIKKKHFLVGETKKREGRSDGLRVPISKTTTGGGTLYWLAKQSPDRLSCEKTKKAGKKK